jgi:glycosyltransferase involved in cell wall biosynthesis
VLQVVRRTRPGGDREVAYQIVRRADPARFAFEVAADRDGPFWERFEEAAEAVHRVPFNASPPASPKVTGIFRRLVRERCVDLVHVHGLPVGQALAVLRGAGPVPVVYTVHAPAGHYRRGIRRALAPSLERLLYRRMAAVTFVSPAELRAAREEGGIPKGVEARAIANGVEMARYRRGPDGRERARRDLGLPGDVPVVGCVGRMHEQKDPGMFVRVAAGLVRDLPAARFVWIGEGDPSVRRLADWLGLGERFLVTGHTTRVPELLPALDVFLLTSRWEGLPLALVEAQAAGVAVAASAVNGVLDVVRDGENGLLFPKGDEGAARAAVGRLLADGALRERLAARGLADAGARFEVGRMVRGYEELYEDVLRRR